MLLKGGTYRIVRFLSSGGFGCTYEAEHVMLQKRVAIKEFFVRDFCNRESDTAHITVGTQSKVGLVEKLRKKFIDEARALTHLDHPGIVRVTDVFEENGTAYYVMDFIDGISLGEKVKNSALSEDEALYYIRQVCDALRYVHSNNRLHLDIKPGNIMIDTSGNAILIDFGASKQYDEDGGQDTSSLPGYTPGYAPPEQMSNTLRQFYPATDIYSVGATLYKILSGNNPVDVHSRISGDELEPLPATVSERTKAAIEAALQLSRKSRPQSIDEFLALLGPANEPSRPFIPNKGDDATEFAAAATAATAAATAGKAGGTKNGVPPTRPMQTPTQPMSVPPTRPMQTPTQPMTQPAEQEEKTKSKALPIIIIIAAVVVIGIVVALLLTRCGGTEQSSADEEQTQEVIDSTAEDNTDDAEPVVIEEASPVAVEVEEQPDEITREAIEGKSGSAATTTPVSASTQQSEDVADVAATGELSINYRPSGAEVWLDGEKVGVTPLTLSGIETGSHKIKLVSDGYKAEEIDVDVKTGTNSLAGSMEKQPAAAVTSTSSGKIAGHDYVDLGLSVKWATCNVGASSQTGNGNLYAWGETSIKSKYSDSNSTTNNRDYGDIAGDAATDAALVNWGGTWRLPTQAEVNELLNRCDWEWTTINGVAGYKVISRTNSNWIFLPAAGYREDTTTKGIGTSGNYWTSTPKSGDKKKSYSLNFGGDGKQCKERHRRRGFSIRPVSK